jgi:hypothetical protein
MLKGEGLTDAEASGALDALEGAGWLADFSPIGPWALGAGLVGAGLAYGANQLLNNGRQDSTTPQQNSDSTP